MSRDSYVQNNILSELMAFFQFNKFQCKIQAKFIVEIEYYLTMAIFVDLSLLNYDIIDSSLNLSAK